MGPEGRDPAWKVLSRLVFELNRNAAGYRSIPFPRFITAQVAISVQIDAPGQPARLRIREALENVRRIDQLRTFELVRLNLLTREDASEAERKEATSKHSDP